MIKALIFDNNGVITSDNEERDLASLFGVSLEEFKEPHKEIHPHYALGNISVDEYCKRHGEAFVSDHSVDTIRDVHFNSYILDPEMKECLRDLRDKYTLALMTNFGDGFCEANAEWKLEEVIDRDKLFISSEVGLRKPDEKYYRHVLHELKVRPEEAIFVDDQLKNVEAAERVGMQAILFKDKDQFLAALKEITND